MSVSTPMRCSHRAAKAMQLIRTRAIGLSPMSTQSTPASFSKAAPCSILVGLVPRGGSTSTLMMNSPARSLQARGELASAGGSGGLLSSGRWRATSVTLTELRADPPRGSAARIAAICAGVVPQQPPMIATPASAKRRA